MFCLFLKKNVACISPKICCMNSSRSSFRNFSKTSFLDSFRKYFYSSAKKFSSWNYCKYSLRHFSRNFHFLKKIYQIISPRVFCKKSALLVVSPGISLDSIRNYCWYSAKKSWNYFKFSSSYSSRDFNKFPSRITSVIQRVLKEFYLWDSLRNLSRNFSEISLQISSKKFLAIVQKYYVVCECSLTNTLFHSIVFFQDFFGYSSKDSFEDAFAKDSILLSSLDVMFQLGQNLCSSFMFYDYIFHSYLMFACG